MHRPLAVLRWPAPVDIAQDLLIIAVDTPNSTIRDTARRLVRSVLHEVLDGVGFISMPGQPIRLARQESPAGISVSHESGLSLLAVHRSGQVGIDLLRLQGAPDWLAQLPTLAIDYLGPKCAGQIVALPAEEQWAHFALAWTEHEARLKCRGLGLEEWSAALEAHLSPCRVRPLALPDGYVGSVATLTAAENPAA